VQLKLENMEGQLKVMGGRDLVVPKEQLAQTSVLIELPTAALQGPSTPLKVGIYSSGKRLETVDTVFAGPRNK
jgi:hypothetical protein